jgi:hypothetical protein
MKLVTSRIVIRRFFLVALFFSVQTYAGDLYQGFADRYSVHSGDLNGDGRVDLRVKYLPPVANINNGDLNVPIPLWNPVGDFVLQQDGTGRFSLVSNLTLDQLRAVASWNTVDVDLTLSDFNVDGYRDLLLTGVSAVIPGVQDVFVFAPELKGASPTNIRSWDNVLEIFLRDIIGYLTDPADYYDSGIYYACLPQLVWVQVQHPSPWGGGYWYTWELRQVDVCGNYLDTTNFSVPALKFLNDFVVMLDFSSGTGGMIPGEPWESRLSNEFSEMFGVPLMRGVLESGAQDFGVTLGLLDVLLECEINDWTVDCSKAFDWLRLMRFFLSTFREVALKAFCQEFDPPGPHSYTLTNQVCLFGQAGCNVSNVYFGEMLDHPVTGYWTRKNDPFEHGELGYAELSCNDEVPGLCKALYTWGVDDMFLGFGVDDYANFVFDGGPIQVFRFDSLYKHQNKTVEGHLFHPGTVDRKSRQSSSGGVEIFTSGQGNGVCPKLNEIGGKLVFQVLDSFIFCQLNNNCNPTF